MTDVVDGDTIKIATADGEVGLRLIGIDTPETVHPSKPVECFGPEASAEANRLAAGQQVYVELDSSQGQFDRYGRTLAYVWIERDYMLNWHMVREGFATEYTYDDPYHHLAAFRAAEQSAIGAGRGLWSACQTAAGG